MSTKSSIDAWKYEKYVLTNLRSQVAQRVDSDVIADAAGDGDRDHRTEGSGNDGQDVEFERFMRIDEDEIVSGKYDIEKYVRRAKEKRKMLEHQLLMMDCRDVDKCRKINMKCFAVQCFILVLAVTCIAAAFVIHRYSNETAAASLSAYDEEHGVTNLLDIHNLSSITCHSVEPDMAEENKTEETETNANANDDDDDITNVTIINVINWFEKQTRAVFKNKRTRYVL
jgi:hypothetical protein